MFSSFETHLYLYVFLLSLLTHPLKYHPYAHPLKLIFTYAYLLPLLIQPTDSYSFYRPLKLIFTYMCFYFLLLMHPLEFHSYSRPLQHSSKDSEYQFRFVEVMRLDSPGREQLPNFPMSTNPTDGKRLISRLAESREPFPSQWMSS